MTACDHRSLPPCLGTFGGIDTTCRKPMTRSALQAALEETVQPPPACEARVGSIADALRREEPTTQDDIIRELKRQLARATEANRTLQRRLDGDEA